MSNWTGKHLLITGGTSGIGLSFGQKCLRNGATKLALLDIADTNDAAGALQREFPDKDVFYILTDVADRANVRRSFEEVHTLFGHIDVVVGNAGMSDECQPERTIEVNLMGVVHTTYAAIDLMSTATGGRGGFIINVSSAAGLDALVASPAYTASKHGVLGLTRCFGHESYFVHHGIKFITMCPGFTNTVLLRDAKPRRAEFGMAESNRMLASKLFQTVDQLTDEMLRVLIDEKHGSIWIFEGGRGDEVVLPQYTRDVQTNVDNSV